MKVVAKKRAFVNNTIFHFSTIFSHFGGGGLSLCSSLAAAPMVACFPLESRYDVLIKYVRMIFQNVDIHLYFTKRDRNFDIFEYLKISKSLQVWSCKSTHLCSRKWSNSIHGVTWTLDISN